MASINRSILYAVTLGSILAASGCAVNTPTSQNQQAVEQQPEPEVKVAKQLDTLEFLPSQGYDETGNKIAYAPAINPYLALKGQIPNAEVNLYIAAISAYRRGHYALARKKLEKLTSVSKNLSGPWVKLGQVAKQEGNVEEAESHFRKALEINNKNVNAYIDLALVQRERGNFLDAQNTYAQALQLWPDFPEAHLNLGVLYDLYLNQPKNAQAHYEAFLFLTGEKDRGIKEWLAEVKLRTGIDESFIDTPPLPEVMPLPQVSEPKTAGQAPGGEDTVAVEP